MSPDVVLLIITPFALLIVLLVFVTVNRYIAYKERVALARLGFTPRDFSIRRAQERRGSRGVLWGGVITMMSGLALLLGLSTLGAGYWLIAGLLPLFVGLGMLLIYFIITGAPASEPYHERDVLDARRFSEFPLPPRPESWVDRERLS